VSDLYSGPGATVEMLAGAVEWLIRPYRDGDIPAIVALINTADAVDKLDEGVSEEELHTRFQSPGADPSHAVVVVEGPRLVGMPKDALLGFGRMFYIDDQEARERVYGTPRLVVHPAARGRGLETVLARRLLELACENEQRSDLPRMDRVRVRAFIREFNTPVRELWESFGLRPTRQFWTMARALHDPIDEPRPVDGVNIRNLRRPEDNEPTRTAYNLSFADHWDNQPETEQEWNNWIVMPRVRPDLSWLAEVEDEPVLIAGFCICSIYDQANKRAGRREGWIGELGTIPEWRRKGLGRSLLLHGLHSLRSAGLDTALLHVDSQSPTGAQRLYESVGFRIRDRELQYECGLAEVRL
jgi:mycothiol synthase